MSAPGPAPGSPRAAADFQRAALGTILRSSLLMRAGAWLAGRFRSRPGVPLAHPFDGGGFRERLRDVPIPDWPHRGHDESTRETLEVFVKAGLISIDGDGHYLPVAERSELLTALILYHYRDVESLVQRFPQLNEGVAGRSVLDAGCGAGAYALRFRDMGARRVVAVDADRDRLLVTQTFAAATGGGVSILQGTIERLPLRDGSIDLIHSRVVLPYLHLRRTFEEFARVLAPGGQAILMLHAASFYGWQLSQIRPRSGDLQDAALALMGLAGGLLFSLFGWEPRWWTGGKRFHLTYQSRRAFTRLAASHGFRIDQWDPNGRKPIAWLTRIA